MVALELGVVYLSLVGNHIREIASLSLGDDASAGQALVWVSLSENPLERLPTDRNATGFYTDMLTLDRTLVQELPSWVSRQVSHLVLLAETPWCASNRNFSALGDGDGASPMLDCAATTELNGRYPLSIVEPLRDL
ncbi:hypothetical protein PINS_up017624 [Pythium insidiosum]|nr:hypothetical protein PINS_up017624 [Pythium insidiosum]